MISRNGLVILMVAGLPVEAAAVAAAWWRKPQWLDIPKADRARRLSIALELDRLHHDVVSTIPEHAWLNSPSRMRAAEPRLLQLAMAASAGFRVPDMVVTNEWPIVHDAVGDDVVFKSFRGSLVTRDQEQVVFTTRLSPVDLSDLAARARPYPGFFQPYVQKRRDWRVCVIEHEVLAARVVHQGDAPPVDWRKAQLDGDVAFEPADLPPDVAKRCSAVVRNLDLRYAAIDLVETPEGDFVFLEANANGQYAWLEDELNLPISLSIANALDGLARTRCGQG